jgi:uncharacterized membrane-anchored protein
MSAPTADNLIGRIPLFLRTGAAILITCGLILWMVADRALILRNGAPVRLQTQPVDPRDLFRGDYVILNYRISFVAPDRISNGASFRRGQPVWVEVSASTDRPASIIMAYAAKPRDVPAGHVVLAGTVEDASACLPMEGTNTGLCNRERPPGLRVNYGLESYFVPEGEGRAIEVLPSSRVEILAAVTADGRSAIRALLIDGKPAYQEPPF